MNYKNTVFIHVTLYDMNVFKLKMHLGLVELPSFQTNADTF